MSDVPQINDAWRQIDREKKEIEIEKRRSGKKNEGKQTISNFYSSLERMASQKGGIKKGEKEREKKKKKRERKKRNEKLSIQKLNSSAGKRRKKLEKKFPLGKITCRRC